MVERTKKFFTQQMQRLCCTVSQFTHLRTYWPCTQSYRPCIAHILYVQWAWGTKTFNYALPAYVRKAISGSSCALNREVTVIMLEARYSKATIFSLPQKKKRQPSDQTCGNLWAPEVKTFFSQQAYMLVQCAQGLLQKKVGFRPEDFIWSSTHVLSCKTRQ